MEMTTKSLADALDGIEYPVNIARDLTDAAKAHGLVIVHGASDDLMEFRGAFYDEIDAYEGTRALVDRAGVLDREQIDDDSDEAIAEFVARKKGAVGIEAVWSDDGAPCWQYRTTLPHSIFNVMEDGGVYCIGIVFSIADLPA